MILWTRLRSYIKTQKTPFARFLYSTITQARFFSLPAPKIIFTPLLLIHIFIWSSIRQLMLFFYWKPLFEQYLERKPKKLWLSNGLPYVLGNPAIRIGEHCTLNGKMVICARTNQANQPRLVLGDRVFIGFNTQLFIANELFIGDDCKISEDCILRGYSGHPLDPVKRKNNLADDISDIGPIILEENVWLGHGVKVNPGVRIGKNSVIATGSIVTKNIPANVVAAGIPAKVVKKIPNHSS